MKKGLMFIVVLLVAVALPLQAKDKKPEKDVTIKGEVVDVACYLAQGAKGEKHKDCAEACAKAGGTLGVLTPAGKLYVSILPDDHSASPNAILMDHIAKMVEATGKVRSKGGVQGIMITSVTDAK